MTAAVVVAPVLIPLVAAALQLLAGSGRRRLQAMLGVLSCLALLAIAVWLVALTAGPAGATAVYNLGNWPAGVAIVLVADRLAALMLLLTAVLALAVMAYALGRWQDEGAHFHPQLQLLLVGLDGAFLTGDLFNLFVFFEVLLAASYGLVLHGSGLRRVGAGLHYITINLAASLLFLVGVGLIFGATGTLNMALLAERIPALAAGSRALLQAGAALLGIAFLIKTAVWPLGFWLPGTYSAATPPVAAMFAILSELGVYVLLRLSLLLFGAGAGASAHFGSAWLLWAGIATLCTAMVGMLGARELGKLAAWCVMVSAGTLVGAIALQRPDVTAGALAYLVISVLGAAALFLLDGLMVPRDEPDDVELPPDEPSDRGLFAAEDEERVLRPAPVVFLAGCFLAAGLLVAGLPPLSGFVAKFALLSPMLGTGPGADVLFALVIAAGVASVVALARAGIRIFWSDPDWVFPHARARELGAVIALLAMGLALTFVAAGPWRYVAATARQLHAPDAYIEAVLAAPRARVP